MCDPATSKTDWSVSDACMEAGVDDTGSTDDSAAETSADDTGSPDTAAPDTSYPDTPSDTGTERLDTGMADDVGPDATDEPHDELPEASACGCRTPGGNLASDGALGLATLGLAYMVSRRRR